MILLIGGWNRNHKESGMSKELAFLMAGNVSKQADDWSCIEASADDWSCIEASTDDWSCIEV